MLLEYDEEMHLAYTKSCELVLQSQCRLRLRWVMEACLCTGYVSILMHSRLMGRTAKLGRMTGKIFIQISIFLSR